MYILALDPSSTALGWAVLDSPIEFEFGQVRMSRRKTPLGRVMECGGAVMSILEERGGAAAIVVIEITTGKTARRLGKNVQGLAIYGMAVGAALWATRGCHAYGVTENEWTGGRPKRERLQLLRLVSTDYGLCDDPGGNAGDALGLGLWAWEYIQRLQLAHDSAKSAERLRGVDEVDAWSSRDTRLLQAIWSA